MSNILNIVVINNDEFIPVPSFVTDWLCSLPEDVNVHEKVPQNIIDFFDKEKVQKYSTQEKIKEVFVSSGSWENDRALHMSCYAPTVFESMKDLVNFIKETDTVIDDEFYYVAY